MIVAGRAVRDRRRSLLWWALGILGMVVFSAAFFPSVEGQASFDELVEEMPEALRDLFFSGEARISTAPGYLQARVFSTLLPVLLLVFGIGAGARAIGGAEDDGSLELLLSAPVTRRRVLFERYAAMAGMVGGLGLVATASVLVTSPPVGLLDGVSLAGVVAAGAGATLLALVFASVAFAAGAATGRRAPALGAATVAAVATYLLQGVLGLNDVAHAARFLSPWHWYLGRNMLTDGIAPDALVVPVVVSAALVVAGAAVFERRDLR